MKSQSQTRRRWQFRAKRGLIVPLMVLIAACLGDPADIGAAPATSQPVEGEPQTGGSIVYATGKDITCLDPHVGGDMPQATVALQFLDSLVSQDTEGDIQPWLAEEWTVSDDGLTWTFHLRDDVVFTDGTPFNAEALKANLDHMVDPATQSGTAGGYLKPYVGTEVVDDTTAVVTLDRPYAAFLNVLAQPFLGIQSPKALARPLEENCASPVGSGPFEVVSWTPQQEVVLERNENYNSAPPYAENKGTARIEKITWRIIPENATRYGGLRTGEIDVIDFMPPENFAEAEADERVTLSLNDRQGNPTSLALNITRPPFDDINVRKAFLLASDARNGVESIFLGTATYAGGPLTKPTKFYSPDFEDVYAYDLEEANRLLDEVGWTERDAEGYRVKDGERLTLELPITPGQWPAAFNELLTHVQAKVKDAGFHLDIQIVDSGTEFERNSTFDYDLRAQYWVTNTPDVLRIKFATEYLDSVGYVPNGTGYSNPELDDILNQALASQDPEEREALYHEAQQIVTDAALQLHLYPQSTQLASRNDRVQNVVVEPTLSLPYLQDAWVVAP